MNRVKFFTDCVSLALKEGWTAFGYAKPEYKIVITDAKTLGDNRFIVCDDNEPILIVTTNEEKPGIIKILSLKELLFSHPFIISIVGAKRTGNHFLYEEILAEMSIAPDALKSLFDFMDISGKHIKPIPNED